MLSTQEYHYTDDDVDMSSMPIITLEVMTEPNDSYQDPVLEESNPPNVEIQDAATGVHFLTEKSEEVTPKVENEKDEKETPKARTDLLEYMMRNDGSVVCKLCGEILQSRTHWYRHKYKLHVIHPLNPAPLYQCEQCLVYFKSRKGYIGHLASRHSEVLLDSSPVLTNSQIEAIAGEQLPAPPAPEVKEEPDPELSIPTSSVPNYQATATIVKQTSTKATEAKRPPKDRADWEEKRSREEKLVADIIDRVRRECEAQGSGGAARRGYTRRTTVMHT